MCLFFSSSDVADEMEYDERLAQFRQTRLNPFDRGEEDGPPGGKTPPQNGNVCRSSTQSAAPGTASSSLHCHSQRSSLSVSTIFFVTRARRRRRSPAAFGLNVTATFENILTDTITLCPKWKDLCRSQHLAPILPCPSQSICFTTLASVQGTNWDSSVSLAGSEHPKVYAIQTSGWVRDTALLWEWRLCRFHFTVLTLLLLNTWMLQNEVFSETSASTFSLTAPVCVSAQFEHSHVLFPVGWLCLVGTIDSQHLHKQVEALFSKMELLLRNSESHRKIVCDLE